MIPYTNRFWTTLARQSEVLANLCIERYFRKHVFRWLKMKDFSYSRVNNVYTFRFPASGGQYPRNIVLEYDCKTDLWRSDFGDFAVVSDEPHLLDILEPVRGYLLGGDLRPGDIVVDAGAYDGWVSCVFAGLVGPQGAILALEPTPDNCRKIIWHKEKNHLGQIQVIQKGLSHFCGVVSFQVDKSGMAAEKQAQSEAKQVELEVATLAVLLSDNAIEPGRIKMIKLDIEGGELDCIDEILAFIQDHPRTYACIASYHIVDGQPTVQTIERKCEAVAKLKCISLWQQHLTTYILHEDNREVWDRLQLAAKNESPKNSWLTVSLSD